VRANAVVFLLWSITVPCQSMLKASQQTKVPLIISIIALSLNTFFGYILIYGHLGMPKMGIMGAVTGVIISRAIEMGLYLFVIFGLKNKLSGPLRDFFSWNGDLFGRVIRNSLFTTINEMFWGFGTSMYNAAYGRMGITEFAAVQAGNTILNLFSLACFSVGDASLILVGEQLGAGETRKAKKTASRLLRIAFIIGFVAGALLFVFSRPITSLFALTPLGVHYAIAILTVYSCLLWVKNYNGCQIAGVLRAGGDTRYAMIAELSCVWLIGVPLAFIGALALHLPIYIVVLHVQAEEVTKMFILHRRYKKEKWVRDLVLDIAEEDPDK
jgi:putative MATE family efflux protein